MSRETMAREDFYYVGEQLITVRNVRSIAMPEIELQHLVLDGVPDVGMREVGESAGRLPALGQRDQRVVGCPMVVYGLEDEDTGRAQLVEGGDELVVRRRRGPGRRVRVPGALGVLEVLVGQPGRFRGVADLGRDRLEDVGPHLVGRAVAGAELHRGECAELVEPAGPPEAADRHQVAIDSVERRLPTATSRAR